MNIPTRKEFLKLPIEERRKILEGQANGPRLIEYYREVADGDVETPKEYEDAKLTDEYLNNLLQKLILEVPQLRKLWSWSDGEETFQDNIKLSIVFDLIEKAIPIIEERVKREIAEAIRESHLIPEYSTIYKIIEALKQPKEEGE